MHNGKHNILICYLSILLIYYICTSCGNPKTKNQPSIDNKEFGLFIPFNGYFLEDSECQFNKTPINLNYGYVWQLKNLTPSIQKVQLNNFVSKTSLTTSIINKVFYNSIYINECDASQENSYCNKKNNQNYDKLTYQLSALPKELRICKNNYQYNRFSYEAIALTAAYHIDKAYNFFSKIYPDHNISKISLDIISTLKRTIYNYNTNPESKQSVTLSYWITDNLFYLNQINSIFVCPQSHNAYAILKKNPLWESPFVLAHEFNHHIFLNFNLTPLMIHMRLKFIVDKLKFIEQQPNSLQLKYTVKSSFITAIMEAFADLFGFYTVGEDPQDFNILSCSGINRNVTIQYLLDGTQKILNFDIISKISQAISNNSSTPTDKNTHENISHCHKVDYANPYNIAGILSYGTHYILDNITTWILSTEPSTTDLIKYLNTTLQNSNEIKAFILIQTIRKLPLIIKNINRHNNSTEKLLFKEEMTFLTSLVELMGNILWDNLNPTIKKSLNKKNYQQEFCKISQQVFPALYRLPYAQTNNNCNDI